MPVIGYLYMGSPQTACAQAVNARRRMIFIVCPPHKVQPSGATVGKA
jgi:hypothetical protein